MYRIKAADAFDRVIFFKFAMHSSPTDRLPIAFPHTKALQGPWYVSVYHWRQLAHLNQQFIIRHWLSLCILALCNTIDRLSNSLPRNSASQWCWFTKSSSDPLSGASYGFIANLEGTQACYLKHELASISEIQTTHFYSLVGQFISSVKSIQMVVLYEQAAFKWDEGTSVHTWQVNL